MKASQAAVTALAAVVGTIFSVGAAAPALAASTSGWTTTATLAVPTPAGAIPLGQLPAETPVSITVGLALRNQSQLESFIASSATPASPDYGDEYTPAGFSAAYGPTSTAVASVTRYLDSTGFTDLTVSGNHLLVTAEGTAADAEEAFHTTLESLNLDGADVYLNSSAAEVPSALSGTVVGVLGLNDVFKATPAPVSTSSGTAGTLPNVVDEYTPEGFWKAYEATGEPTGSETAIATFSSGAMTAPIANLRSEEAANGLPKVPVTVEHAGIESPNTPTGNVEWDLDSQFATGMAGNVAHFYYYDTTSLSDATLARDFNLFASQDLAKAGSASLGECEVQAYLDGSMVIDDEVFAEAAAQGQTVFASAGDTGASCAVEDTNGVPDSGPPGVNYPASSPYVVAVGGTTLITKSTGSYDTELSWDAGGGGISTFETVPYWQKKVMPVTDGDTGYRGVPDMAMDANPTTGADVYTTTGVEGVGGTSLSAPLALGVWARVESDYSNRLGFASPDLYGVYLAGTCTATLASVEEICTTPAFHAPVAGDNGLYPETPGYNYDTGLGTFDTAGLVGAIEPFVPAAVHPGPPLGTPSGTPGGATGPPPPPPPPPAS